MTEVKDLFRAAFGNEPAYVVHAPGRLELLGNHTDYNDGLVMSVAVDREISIASSPRNDGRIELVSSAFPTREIFPIDRLEKNPSAPWTNYIKGVLLCLRQRGVHFTGFNAAIHGTIPLGAGMSSSAALEVAAALTLRQLFPFRLTDTGLATPPARDRRGTLPSLAKEEKLLLAKICQTAESHYVGVNCGLLDPISSLFGLADHVIETDCLDHSVSHTPMARDFEVVVGDSGVKHALSDGKYNELRAHSEAAARALQVRSLRFAAAADVEANRHKLTEREYQCARHVTGENQRVVFGERALRQGEMEVFGQYLFQSHESSRDDFHNSCGELDILVEIAARHPGCLGARLTGGGFGGATLNLVRRGAVQEFATHMTREYQDRTGRWMEPLICRIVNGAH